VNKDKTVFRLAENFIKTSRPLWDPEFQIVISSLRH